MTPLPQLISQSRRPETLSKAVSSRGRSPGGLRVSNAQCHSRRSCPLWTFTGPSRSSQTPNHQDDNINFKIVTLHSHSVSTLAPQDPLQSLPQPQWDLRVHLPSHILIRLCECTSGSLCPLAFSLLPATHVGVHRSWLICRSSVINEHTTS
ncbi:hypothetical protein P692DRAFT_20874678 [Suillus brevipes Sb2]|nr:hypothetical protein P692DRAFT_20874678 [Suillus brevipes Sb2]